MYVYSYLTCSKIFVSAQYTLTHQKLVCRCSTQIVYWIRLNYWTDWSITSLSLICHRWVYNIAQHWRGCCCQAVMTWHDDNSSVSGSAQQLRMIVWPTGLCVAPQTTSTHRGVHFMHYWNAWQCSAWWPPVRWIETSVLFFAICGFL